MRKIILFTIFTLTVCTIIYSCQSASEIELAKYMTGGKDLYETYCQNCHGAKGEGLGELAPPLTDSVFLKNNVTQLACIIKNGANKEMVVHGKKYEGKMPAFEKMKDIDVAQVITYVTNSFGNKQGIYQYNRVTNDLQNCN